MIWYEESQECEIAIFDNPVSFDTKIGELEDLEDLSDDGEGVGMAESADPDKRDENKRRNLRRAKQNVYRIARCNRWDFFVGNLSFRKEICDRYSYDEISKKLRMFLKMYRRRKADENFKYLLVFDQHKDGAWHMHGLMSGVAPSGLADSGKRRLESGKYVDASEVEEGEKTQMVYHWTDYRLGWSSLTEIPASDSVKCSTYICDQHFEKGMNAVPFGRSRFLVSRNVKRPDVETMNMSFDEAWEFQSQLTGNLVMSKYVPLASGSMQPVGVHYFQYKGIARMS